MAQARGTFHVTLLREPPFDGGDGVQLARASIEKRFEGDLTGGSTGQMLSAGGPVKGSAGYVALERVQGTLGGRNGTFVLQHSGTMTRGAAELVVSVVPDTGTGDLTGISGRMKIDIVEGKHLYTFDYDV